MICCALHQANEGNRLMSFNGPIITTTLATLKFKSGSRSTDASSALYLHILMTFFTSQYVQNDITHNKHYGHSGAWRRWVTSRVHWAARSHNWCSKKNNRKNGLLLQYNFVLSYPHICGESAVMRLSLREDFPKHKKPKELFPCIHTISKFPLE